jgi:hypothetical protein
MKATDDPTAFLGAAKESGDIEFDCATLMFLDVDKLHEGAEKPARIAVARCRVGDVGFVGIRAQLAIGKFEEDPKALVEMSAESRQQKREQYTSEKAAEVLIRAVRALPGRPWRDIQTAATKGTGVNRGQIEDAKKSLIENGVLIEHDRYDITTGRKEQGHSYTVREEAAPPGVIPKEGE